MKGLVIQGKHEKGGGGREPCVDSQAGGSRTVGVKWSMEDSARRQQVSEERRMLAARRRVLQQQVADLVEQARTDEDDGYEEICFGGGEAEASKDSKLEDFNHHYLTPISILERNRSPLEASRKSISDTDLLAIMDENREIELHQLTNSINSDAVNSIVTSSSVLPTDRTFGREPEQGFYRVYDELDRVKEWHLIPYVIARKAKLEEEAKKQEETKTVVTTVKPCASSAGSDKVSVKSEGTTSRTSVDSGRASVMSGAENKKDDHKQRNSVEDAGSNCSADSGTYNLYDEQQQQQQHRSSEFLNKVSQQLDSCMNMRARSKSTASSTSRRRRTPPPPPTLTAAASRDASPPPLPPRSKTTTAPARRKDLSSFFGLLQDEPNQLLSKRVARSVAMRNLSSSSSSPLKQAASLESSPPGKKDLTKYLGIHDGSREGTMVRQHHSGSASSLLKCLGASPGSVLQRSLRKLSPKQLEFVQKREEEMQEVLDRVLVSPPPKKQQNHVRRVLDFEDSALFREDGQSSKKKNLNIMTRCSGSEVFLVGNTPPSRVTKVEATKPPLPTNQSSQGEKNKTEKQHLPPPILPAVEAANKSMQTSPPHRPPSPPPPQINNNNNKGASPQNNNPKSAVIARMLLMRTPHLIRGNFSSPKRTRSSSCSSPVRKGSYAGKSSARRGRSPSLTPVTTRGSKRRSGRRRRSLMATLLQSGKKGDSPKIEDVKVADEEVIVTDEAKRETYNRNLREARRQGLPVIPFLNGSPIRQDSNNNKDTPPPREELHSQTTKRLQSHHHRPPQAISAVATKENDAPPPIRNGVNIPPPPPPPKRDIKSSRQPSNPYLPMMSLPRSVQALATPSGLCRASNYAPHSMLNFGSTKPLSVWQDQEQQQHCKSCTCQSHPIPDPPPPTLELDYVRMENRACSNGNSGNMMHF